MPTCEHPGCVSFRSLKSLLARLDTFGRCQAERDDLVRDACAAGIGKLEIHLRTGLARTTIDRILRSDGA